MVKGQQDGNCQQAERSAPLLAINSECLVSSLLRDLAAFDGERVKFRSYHQASCKVTRDTL